MKGTLLSVLFFVFSLASFGQSTWVQRLNYIENDQYINTDSITGIKDIALGADRDLYVLASTDQDNSQSVYKISPSGAPIRWYVMVGYHSGMSGQYAIHVRPTSDSGCIVCNNFWNDNMYGGPFGFITKYSKNGTTDWVDTLLGNSPYYIEEAVDAIENNAGNYYALSGDSLYELDKFGKTITATDTLVGNTGDQIYQLPNGKVFKVGSIASNMPTYYFTAGGSSVQKIDYITGTVWSRTYSFSPISSINATADGGAIVSCGYTPGIYNSSGYTQLSGILFKIDSSGSVVWNKTFDFPHFGLGCVKQLPSGNIITGGTFIFTDDAGYFFVRDYAAFVASLDSTGVGPLTSTTLTWPGDANNNQTLSFVDDALYVMAALGDTGPKRDTLDPTMHCPYFECGNQSDYATDWANSFCTGVNHKHADFNGDGVIDTNDITIYSGIDPIDLTFPSWRIGRNIYNTSVPDFKLVPEHDSIAAGDSINFFIIAGSSSVPVDSIYGLAFQVTGYYPKDTTCVTDTVVFKNSSALGTLGVNLYQYYCREGTWFCWLNDQLLCRTDQQNVYNLNDTLGIITLYSDTGRTDSLILALFEFNAITVCGAVVPFNTSGGGVRTYRRLPVSVQEQNEEAIKIYPNPSNHFVMVNTTTSAEKKVVVYNSLGEIVKDFNSSDVVFKITTDDLPGGVYFLKVNTGERQWVEKTVVE